MPQRKYSTPEPLEDLCLTAVVRCLETDLVLCEVAKGLAPSSLLLRRIDLGLPQVSNTLTEYISILPGTLSDMVRQKITTRVIKRYTNATSNQPKSTIPFNGLSLHTMTLRLLEVSLNEDIHTFDLSELDPSSCPASLRPEAGDPEVWELLLNRCTELRKLALPPSLNKCFGADIGSFITMLAPQCTKLTEIILKDAVQDGKVLSAFGQHVPNLRVLDLNGSLIVCTDVLYLIFPKLCEVECVSNCSPKSKKGDLLPNLPSGLHQSRLCNKLQQLNVSNTKMRSLGVYYALKYFPNLESLGVCYSVPSGIKKLCQEGWSNLNLNLKQAYTAGLSRDKMILVCSACPKLESLSVGSGGVHPYTFKFSSLSILSHIKVLTLETSCSLDLSGLRYASQLTELNLHVPGVDFGHVAEACPLLKRLTVTKEPIKTFTISKDRFKPSRFKNLQEIEIDCPVYVKAVSLIMTEATFLRVAKFVRIKKLSDAILKSWLQINPLACLETWLLTYSHLTSDSVTLLLDSCPKLSTLGRLSGWDVRSWEARRLERTWQSFDLNIILFSHKKEDISEIMDATASSDEERD